MMPLLLLANEKLSGISLEQAVLIVHTCQAALTVQWSWDAPLLLMHWWRREDSLDGSGREAGQGLCQLDRGCAALSCLHCLPGYDA